MHAFFFQLLVESGWPPWRPHSEARSDSSNFCRGLYRGCRERPRRGETATAASSPILVPKAEVGQNAMSDQKEVTRSGSIKPKLSPRRDFGPAQDFPCRQRQFFIKVQEQPQHDEHKTFWFLALDDLLSTKVIIIQFSQNYIYYSPVYHRTVENFAG